MKYRALGKTLLRASEVGLGCEEFAKHDEAFAVRMLDIAMARGVNFFDLFVSDPALRSRQERH